MSDEITTTTEPEAVQDSDELISARLDAAGARAGLEPGYLDVAQALLKPWLAEKKLGASKEHLERYIAELRTSKPALFKAGPPAARTTAPAALAPAAPGVAATASPAQAWRALRAAGRMGEAEVFYMKNRRAIMRDES